MASHVADAASRPPSWTTLRTPEVDDCCCGLGFAPSEEGSGRSQEDHEGCAQVAKRCSKILLIIYRFDEDNGQRLHTYPRVLHMYWVHMFQAHDTRRADMSF